MTGPSPDDPNDTSNGENPDVAFNLGGVDAAPPEPSPGSDQAESGGAFDADIGQVVDALTAVAPSGWRALYAEFAVTVSAEAAQAVYSVGESEVPVPVPKAAQDLVRGYREASAERGDEPWWRLLVHVTADGEIDVDQDRGERPFPNGQLFAPEAYRADLDKYPRERLPVWLAAYIGHAGRQSRSPRQAVLQARSDRAAGIWSELVERELPPLPVMWARWTTIAAAFVAVGSEWGPRMMPSLGWFESARRSGSTLCLLPGGRAVLSGGVWNAPALDLVYNGGEAMPDYFAGAPDWVVDQVLNPRTETGTMSFCYWWEAGRWYRGASPPAEECAPAIPGVWSVDTVSDIVARLRDRRPGAEQITAANTLVTAAEVGVVTRETVGSLFGDDSHDIDGALFQFRVAGLIAEVPDPLPQELAVLRVRQYVLGRGLDTTGYPLDELVADRLSCGWMVYVPVPDGEIAIGRAIFYIADDGVLEPSSASVPPTRFVAGFEQRFQQRQRSGV
ncbi:hypothetical protein ACFVMC_29460 [Nocardia sp. NPDC127579]|uniref:hypothetical protein n=1 Tax=Nocardia sp. NPDC127579 TaxID=3345402 RepID=UPI0036408925